MRQERVRIIDIAEELGLSTATVSNVIHGKTKRVSGETVKRVQELLEKRGYIPDMAGILLAQNSSGIVGVVVNNHEKYEGRVLEDGFISASLNALSAELDKAGYFMLVKVLTDWNEIVKVASMWNMEGLVIIGFCEQEYHKLREKMHIPFVVYDGYLKETGKICNLVIDNYGGGFMAGEYLRQMGHKRVLCIADNYICMDKERIDGLRDGIKDGMADFLQIPQKKEERDVFYQGNLDKIMEYTAVFAVSDFYAAELIYKLQEYGLKVPKDMSVIGFDDSFWCEKVYPSLSTIRQDPGERARLAVSILKEMKQGVYEKTSVILKTSLVKRGSVAAPAWRDKFWAEYPKLRKKGYSNG